MGGPKVPTLVYRMWKSKFVKPTKGEGFEEIVSIDWCPDFEDEKARKLFCERS